MLVEPNQNKGKTLTRRTARSRRTLGKTGRTEGEADSLMLDELMEGEEDEEDMEEDYEDDDDY